MKKVITITLTILISVSAGWFGNDFYKSHQEKKQNEPTEAQQEKRITEKVVKETPTESMIDWCLGYWISTRSFNKPDWRTLSASIATL